MDEAADRIIPLDRTEDFEVAHDEPDVRGWDVYAADGRRIGRVEDLLVDADAMKVRYLDVSVEAEYYGGEGGHRILIPIGYALLDERGGTVEVASLDSGRVRDLPEYDDGELTERYAEDLEIHFAAGDPIGPPREVDRPRSVDIDDRVDGWVDETRLAAEPTPTGEARDGNRGGGEGPGPSSDPAFGIEKVEGSFAAGERGAPGAEGSRGIEQGHASHVLEDGPPGDGIPGRSDRPRATEPNP